MSESMKIQLLSYIVGMSVNQYNPWGGQFGRLQMHSLFDHAIPFPYMKSVLSVYLHMW